MAINSLDGWKRKAFQDFTGGLNTFSTDLIVKQNQFTQLTNALVNSTGVLEKQKGYSIDGSPFPATSDSFIRMLVNYRRGTTVDKLVCAALDAGNTNVTYQVDLKESSGDGTYSYIYHNAGTDASFTSGNTAVTGTATTWLSHLKTGDKIKASAHADAAYTEIASVNSDVSITLVAGGYLGATAANVAYKARKIQNKDFIPSAITFNNNLIITNGSDKPMTYNNTTLNDITDTDAPKGKFIVAHKSRVFIAGTSGGPSSIYWSAINDETSWDAAGFEIVFANDNGNICGIKSFADSLIVLKDNGNIYQVVGSFDQDEVGEPDFIRKIDAPLNIGMIAGFSAVVHDDHKLYFLTETGVYSLDSRMFVEKTSWDIKPTTDSIALRSGQLGTKSYIFDSDTQFNSGTHDGTVSRSNKLQNYQDLLTITDATQKRLGIATTIDSNNDIHVAYIDSSNTRSIRYKKWLATTNAVSVDETALTLTTTGTDTNKIIGLSITVASSGEVCIGYTYLINDALTYGAYALVERSTATPAVWTNTVVESSVAGYSNAYVNNQSWDIAIAYKATGTDLVGIMNAGTGDAGTFGTGVGGNGFYRSSGTVTSRIATMPGLSAGICYSVSLNRTGSNFYAVFVTSSSQTTPEPPLLRTFKSTNSGVSWTAVEDLSVTITGGGNVFYSDAAFALKPQVSANAAGNLITSYISSTGTLIKRNHSTATSTTIDSATTNVFKGFVVNSSDKEFYYYGTGSTLTEKYTFDTSSTVTNATTGTIIATKNGSSGFANNGSTYCSASFGANSNEVLIRRLAFIATWLTPEESDSSLTAWGTYVVTGQVSNGNTIAHSIALNTISPPSSFNTITSGTVISTDATQVFAKAKVIFTMAAFAGTEIDSITLNYTGVGIGPLIPSGIIFNNEYYLAYGTSSDTANTSTLLFDRGQAWSITAYPVIFMTRYRNALYGGSATGGKVFKLLQNYRFNTSAYTLTATSKEDLLGSIELQKEVAKVYVIYKIQPTGTFDFSYRVDNFATTGGATWVTTTVDQTADGIAEIPVRDGLMHSIQFKIEQDEIDAQLGIVGYVVLYQYVRIR